MNGAEDGVQSPRNCGTNPLSADVAGEIRFTDLGRPDFTTQPTRDSSWKMTVSNLPSFRVFIIGGSYAGLSVLQNVLRLNNGEPLIQELPPGSGPKLPPDARVRRGIHITLVDERDGFFNTIGAPLAHVAHAYVQPFWRLFADIKALQRPDITILQARLKHVDAGKQKLTLAEIANGVDRIEGYDYLVLATGLKREFPIVPNGLHKDQYLQAAQKHIEAIEKAEGGTVVVIGGGELPFPPPLPCTSNDQNLIVWRCCGDRVCRRNSAQPSLYQGHAHPFSGTFTL